MWLLALQETGSLISAAWKIHALSCNLKQKVTLSSVRPCKIVWERCKDCLCSGEQKEHDCEEQGSTSTKELQTCVKQSY